VRGVCVPFTGLHLCDLLLHVQSFVVLFQDWLVDVVSKRWQRWGCASASSYRKQAAERRGTLRRMWHDCDDAVRKTYQRKSPVKVPCGMFQAPAYQPVDAARTPGTKAGEFEVVEGRKDAKVRCEEVLSMNRRAEDSVAVKPKWRTGVPRR